MRSASAVSVSHRDPGGTVQISYRNLEQLDEAVRRLEGGRLGCELQRVGWVSEA